MFLKLGPKESSIKFWNLSEIREFIQFVGSRVRKYFAWSLAVAVLVFAVEVGFALGLQALLHSLRIADSSQLQLPEWIKTQRTSFIFAGFIGIAILRSIFMSAQTWLQVAVTEEFKFHVREMLLHWAFHRESVSTSTVQLNFFERVNTGSSVVNSSQVFIVRIVTVFCLFISLVAMLPVPTLVACAILGLLIFVMHKRNKTTAASSQFVNREWAKTNRMLVNNIKNLLLMQIYGTQHKEEARSQQSLAAHKFHSLEHYRSLGVTSVVPPVIGIFVVCVIAYISVHFSLVSAGALVSYLYIFFRFVQGISEGFRSFANIQFQGPQILELFNWWKIEYRHQPEYSRARLLQSFTKDFELSKPIGWSLKNLSFRYPTANNYTIQNFNLNLKPGSFLALVGPSGCGKSTILSLMLGILTPTGGEVQVHWDTQSTQDIQKIKELLLENIGYVGAESFLVEGTLYENLVYGLSHEPTQDEVEEALVAAECQFVFDLPDGLEHSLTEQGQGLSAGQKQRLSLARALLRKPKALILDEATANLDTNTESRLIETLLKLKGKVTIIAATHREAVAAVADQIIEMSPYDHSENIPAPGYQH